MIGECAPLSGCACINVGSKDTKDPWSDHFRGYFKYHQGRAHLKRNSPPHRTPPPPNGTILGLSKTLALIHTSPVLVPGFNELAARLLPGIRVFHMVDESLIKNTIRTGHLEKKTIRRVVHHIEAAADAGADAVLVTCSSIGPATSLAMPLFDMPVMRIDEPMARKAVESGRRIGVLATLATTLEPTVQLLRDTAAAMGAPSEISSKLCAGAFEAVVSGDTATHDRMVTEGLRELFASVDVIVLAQASMARVADQLPPEQRPIPILSSPSLAMEYARAVIEKL